MKVGLGALKSRVKLWRALEERHRTVVVDAGSGGG
jgi:hypothetical protein